MKYLVVLGALVCWSLSSAFAQTEMSGAHIWTIAKMNGKAWIQAPNQPAKQVSKDSKLHPGQVLRTEERTRLLLTRGKERIQVGPNTQISLPKDPNQKPGYTRIFHKSGTIHLTVEKRNVEHFSVATPYLVAAVKGTKFTISVKDKQSSIRVHEGIVEVLDTNTKRRADVTAGQTATIWTGGQWAGKAKFKGLGTKQMVILERGEDHPTLDFDWVSRQNHTSNNMSGLPPIMQGIVNGIWRGVNKWLTNIYDAALYWSEVITKTVIEIFTLSGPGSLLYRIALFVGSVGSIGLAIFAYIKIRNRRKLTITNIRLP